MYFEIAENEWSEYKPSYELTYKAGRTDDNYRLIAGICETANDYVGLCTSIYGEEALDALQKELAKIDPVIIELYAIKIKENPPERRLLDKKVFIAADGEIVETTVGDTKDDWMDVTITPQGMTPRLHVRGKELWTWGHGGNNPLKVVTYQTEMLAQLALEDMFYQDFIFSGKKAWWFDNRDAAEMHLAGSLKEQ